MEQRKAGLGGGHLIRQVRTENGWIRGLPASDPRITSYKGVPYAAPPVGENRWRAPQPCESWEGVREAYAFSPIPMQAPVRGDPGSLYDREWHVDADIPMSEDCLTLNIWAPADGRQGMPVLVWYYGGGLQVGYSAEMEMDGERIARRGIVVCTVNYRVGCFGFLCHPEITRAQKEAPANFGFLDQQAATRWVRRNIAAFGGDPDSVTIGGQSAGGMSVSAQMTCPGNRGLFRRAIIESGAFASPYPSGLGLTATLEEAEKRGEAFFRFLGVRSLEEARKMDAFELRDRALDWEKVHGWAKTFGEAVDGVFSLRSSQEWFLDRNCLPVSVLMGFTKDEFPSEPPARCREELPALARACGAEEEAFLSCFREPVTRESILRDGTVNAIAFAARAAAHRQDETGIGPLYLYRFGAEIPGWDHPGAFHSVDLWFFFETLAKCWRPFRGWHYDLARQMCDCWCNFIKTGDPNGTDSQGETLPLWPQLRAENPICMDFSTVAVPVPWPEKPLESCLLNGFLEKYGRL